MPTGVYKRKPISEETRMKISKSHIGIVRSNETKKRMSIAKKNMSLETKKKISIANTGRIVPKEVRKKMSEAQKGRKILWKDKIGNANRGKKMSLATRKKMSIAKTGTKQTEEHKRKIREAISGEKNYNWKGGNKIYSVDWTELLKESIRQRDDFICQECGMHQDEMTGKIKKLDIHHIDYDKENCNPDNLIALCRKCHVKTNFNREYWIKYFNN